MKAARPVATSTQRGSHALLYPRFLWELLCGSFRGGPLFYLWMTCLTAIAVVGLLSGNRNLALLLAVLVDRAEFDVLLFFAVGQFPIFVLPAVLAPVYRRIAQGAPLDASAAGRS